MDLEKPQAKHEKREDTRYVVSLGEAGGQRTVEAHFADDSYMRPSEYKPRIPSMKDLEEDWVEMEAAGEAAEVAREKAYYETYDPGKEYAEKLATVAVNEDEIIEACDVLAAAFAEDAKFYSKPPSEEVREALRLVNGVVKEAGEATPEMYAALPHSTKAFIEYCDRVVQLDHLLTGSSYVTPMENLYSKEEVGACVEDFFAAAEQTLGEMLPEDGELPFAVTLPRPKQVAFINGASNLVHAIIEKIDTPKDHFDLQMEVLHKVATAFTQKYRDDRNDNSPAK